MDIFLDHTQVVAPNITSFWFKSSSRVDYVSGQFVELYLPHNNADGRGQKRWFTLSSSPTEELISITTKRGSSTFKQKLFGLKPGEKIAMSQPMGDFVLPKDPTIPLVFVAGGIGITPVRSIIKYLTDTNQKRNITIIYAVKYAGQAIFEQLFRDYCANLQILLDELDGQKCLSIVNSTKNALFYVSGPEPMTEKLQEQLLAEGVLPQNLVLDFFPGYI